MRWDLNDLVSPADIAKLYDTSRATVSNWVRRYPDFPRPLAVVAQGHTALYSRRAVTTWHDGRDWRNDGPGSKAEGGPARNRQACRPSLP